MSDIGNHSPSHRSDENVRAPLGDRILAAMATWVRVDGTVVEPTTADLAARLGIEPESPERGALDAALRRLRERRLLRYEMRPDIEWRLTGEGWDLARRIPTGASGWGRSARDDRDRDRFAQARDGTIRERRDARP